jgi:hypothetical protein
MRDDLTWGNLGKAALWTILLILLGFAVYAGVFSIATP